MCFAVFLAIMMAGIAVPAYAVIVYQDFEDENGTPHRDDRVLLEPEYGWGFNGAIVERTQDGTPVHSGKKAWSVTVPAGPPVHAGTAVVSQTQGRCVNVVPECHDRLSFWIWSAPSRRGDHTVMVKFFDRGQYRDRGIGLWTRENQRAADHQWSRLEIDLHQLPTDFNLRQLDKIEFFNYWDGTYYYDDIEFISAYPPETDWACLEGHDLAVCDSPRDGDSPRRCVSVFDPQGELVLDLLRMRRSEEANPGSTD